LITAAELVDSGEAPTREGIRAHLSGNFCRCTGYQGIVNAVHRAAETMRTHTG
ncbi:MAG: 4-hydroxybenzoyl-CoA reductase subunit gamma, partial [Mycobacteriaceae bacterium]|nr:4-hydroxybenzoyl-CoA reductase subunit gamma [Mycobacteriaceae bacterium]